MGLTFDKLLIIGVIAVFLLGPERLPHYASQLARLVRGVRDMANGAKERMREEMGPDFDDVDWKKLDPRQYDPRRIIREALLDDDPEVAPTPPTVLRAPRTKETDDRNAQSDATSDSVAGASIAAAAAATAGISAETGSGQATSAAISGETASGNTSAGESRAAEFEVRFDTEAT